jgi:hypothetical protein
MLARDSPHAGPGISPELMNAAGRESSPPGPPHLYVRLWQPREPDQRDSGSSSLPVSSWISAATLASASAYSRLWCAQKSSSLELGSRTRTYACAPQRSHTSKAVSGFAGARVPVNVAFLAVPHSQFTPSGLTWRSPPPSAAPGGTGWRSLRLWFPDNRLASLAPVICFVLQHSTTPVPVSAFPARRRVRHQRKPLTPPRSPSRRRPGGPGPGPRAGPQPRQRSRRPDNRCCMRALARGRPRP